MMSLEELRNDWDSIDKSIEDNKISNEQIKRILRVKYRSFIFRILIFETIILLGYVYFIAFITFMFDELEILYLEILGIISIVILMLLVVIRLGKLNRTYRNRFLSHSHITTLKKLAKQNIKNQKFFLLNIILGFLLVVILVVLNIKIYHEYDLIQSKYFWLIITPSSFIVILLVNFWNRKYYRKVIRKAENLLKELK